MRERAVVLLAILMAGTRAAARVPGSRVNAFIDGTLCVRGTDGYAWRPFLFGAADVPDHTLNVATYIDVDYWPDAGAKVCAIRWDAAMTCQPTASQPFQDPEPGIKGAAIGFESLCAARTDGTVLCGAYPETTTDQVTQYWAGPFDELGGVVPIVAAGNAACARTETGDMNVWCWGIEDCAARRGVRLRVCVAPQSHG
jgi:hypothetical protein